MATTISLTSQSYEGRYLRLDCTQTIDIAANKSQIAWTLSSIGGIEVYYATGATTVTIGGTVVYYCGRMAWNSYKFPAAKGSVSGTIDIYHDDNGSKTIDVAMSTAIYYSAVQGVQKSWTLDTIPRASQPSCITYPQTTEHVGTLGGSFHIHMNSADGSFRHALYYWRNNKWNLIATEVENNYLWTTPVDLANDVPNSMEYAGQIAVDTYSGSKFIGTKTVNFKADVPAYNITGTVSVTGNNLYQGLYVEGKSSATITVAPKSAYSATIKSITSTVDGKSYSGSPFTTSVFSKGTKSVKSVIVDSRGKTATIWSSEFNVVEYSLPWITSFTVERQENGTTVIAKLQGGVSSIGNKNTKSFEVTLNGVTKSITASGYTVDGTATFTNVSTDDSFEVTAKISDYYTSVSKNATIPTVAVTLDFHHSGKGIAMGKVAQEENLLDLAWDLKIKGNLLADFVVEQGSSGIWIYRKWNSGIAECWGVSDVITQTTSTDWNIMTSNIGTPAVSYPFEFKNPPVVSPSVHIHDMNFWLVTMSAGTTTKTPTYQIARGKSASTVNFKMGYYVFGQWK